MKQLLKRVLAAIAAPAVFSVFSLLMLASCGGEAEVTGVTVLPKIVELSIGKTAQLEAIVSPDDAANKVVIWTTSDDKTQVRVVSGTTGKSGSYVSKTSAYALVRPIIVF